MNGPVPRSFPKSTDFQKVNDRPIPKVQPPYARSIAPEPCTCPTVWITLGSDLMKFQARSHGSVEKHHCQLAILFGKVWISRFAIEMRNDEHCQYPFRVSSGTFDFGDRPLVAQSRADEHSKRYDDIQNAILKAAENSTDYWLKLQKNEDRRVEAHLVGHIHMINGLTVSLAIACKDQPRIHAGELQEFYELTTGGENFENGQRKIDISRARAVQLEAARLILYFQKYQRQRLTLRNSIRIGIFGAD